MKEHSKNGNINSSKQLKVIQINKGNSKLFNVDNEFLETITENKEDIAIISEANHNSENGELIRNIASTFSEYNVESKNTIGSSTARVLIIIKKEVMDIL